MRPIKTLNQSHRRREFMTPYKQRFNSVATVIKMIREIFLFLCITSVALAAARAPRIIGGTVARVGHFKFAAAIRKNTADGVYFCGGAIISTEWLLTAAQCVDGATLLEITLGVHSLSNPEESKVEIATDEYVLHPGWDPATLANDLGLIKTRMPITFNDYIDRAVYPYHPITSWSFGTALGWGETADSEGELSDTLQFVSLRRHSDAECQSVYGTTVPPNVVCYGGNLNEGTCFGDSGSPLVTSVGAALPYLVLGVNSFFSANGCETPEPSGFTAIWPNIEWIYNTTGVNHYFVPSDPNDP